MSRPTTTRRFLPLLTAAALLGGAPLGTGCNMESSTDVYLQGLQVEGRAEKKECKLVYDQESGTHVINSEKIAACLEKQKEALALYEKAGSMGHEGKDFDRTLAQAKDRTTKLESMYEQVKRMEAE